MKRQIKYLNYGFLLILIMLTGLIIAGCGSGELSRSEVESMVKETNDFKAISTLNLMTTAESMGNRYFTNQSSPSETKEEAMKRDLENFLFFDSDIALARHLGYLDIKQKFVKFQPRFLGIDPNFKFSVTIRPNKKGKALWAKTDVSEGAEVNREKELPLATKEFGEVTGITKQGENTAIAEFTYRWNPNELGKYYDSSSDEFKKLPEELQNSLQGKSSTANLKNKTVPWGNEGKGQAIFQKFDNGWRLQSVRL